MAFASAIKTSALNWPHHRGTATAFPLAAFGLSAFFFSLIGSIFFPGSPGRFLMVLAIGTSSLILSSFFFYACFRPRHPTKQSLLPTLTCRTPKDYVGRAHRTPRATVLVVATLMNLVCRPMSPMSPLPPEMPRT